jgi:hypothetical protein
MNHKLENGVGKPLLLFLEMLPSEYCHIWESCQAELN